MINIENSFLTNPAIDYAELSYFAYAEWMPAGTNNWVLDPIDEDYSKQWDDEGMANKYSIVSHRATDSTGFSATLFQDKETGKYILSIRGTDSLKDVFGPDVELSTGKMPVGQFESLVSYITQIRTIFGNITFDVTGHSLGGFLAQVVKATFSNIGDVYTYNAPGAKNLIQYVNEGIQPDGKVKVSIPGGSLFSSFEWSQATWDAYQSYLDNRNNTELGKHIYNISGKDTFSGIANWGTDIGMEVFIDGSSHFIADMIASINTGKYYTDAKKPAAIIGSKADEVLEGNYSSEHYNSQAQPVVIAGCYGNDEILGGISNDTLYGDLPDEFNTNDIKRSGNEGGASGNDTLTGGDGNDIIYGGSGNDILLRR